MLEFASLGELVSWRGGRQSGGKVDSRFRTKASRGGAVSCIDDFLKQI